MPPRILKFTRQCSPIFDLDVVPEPPHLADDTAPTPRQEFIHVASVMAAGGTRTRGLLRYAVRFS